MWFAARRLVLRHPRGGLLGDAETAWHRWFRELACSRRAERQWLRRRLHLLPSQLDDAFADEQTVEDDREADHERDQAREPEVADKLGFLRIRKRGHRVHEEVKKDRHTQADGTGN